MNNKGFAITSILYGLLVMFLLIVVGSLGILSNQKKLMEELIDGDNGARDIVQLETINLDEVENFASGYKVEKRALYVYGTCKKYYAPVSGKDVIIFPSDMNSNCIN